MLYKSGSVFARGILGLENSGTDAGHMFHTRPLSILSQPLWRECARAAAFPSKQPTSGKEDARRKFARGLNNVGKVIVDFVLGSVRMRAGHLFFTAIAPVAAIKTKCAIQFVDRSNAGFKRGIIASLLRWCQGDAGCLMPPAQGGIQILVTFKTKCIISFELVIRRFQVRSIF